ncbi:hypothetical protein [Fontivita pretiosa]|uniref:hypothetical protein n=1 Tax=Fontivita pretiosa TaxID=2989684 RepID=UPI003D163318
MPDQPQQSQASRNLSEISHLFLSGVRQRAGHGAPQPVRTPPSAAQSRPRTDLTVDLTPEEFAHVFGDQLPAGQPVACGATDSSDSAARGGPSIGPVRAVLASHLGVRQLARVQEYAASLCADGQRVGLIAVDSCEFRLSIFERAPQPLAAHPAAQAHETDVLDARLMRESLEELAWDVDRWLLLLPNPRAPEARSLLRDVNSWTLLTTCDHDGIVACYRTLKGLADLHRPRLSIAALDAGHGPEAATAAQQAYQRLSSVCRQFLDWPVKAEPAVWPASDVVEHVVLWCSATRDKAQLAEAPQWQVVADFLAKARQSPRAVEPLPASGAVSAAAESGPDTAQNGDARPATASEPAMRISETDAHSSGVEQAAHRVDEVIDLPDAQACPAAIVAAVLRGGHELVECPVKPPMCPDASLAVSRDRCLVLVAVARQGLSDLRLIGRAYQWLIENRALISMAVPQFAIDAHRLPRLHLLVDHADMSAAVLQPILHAPSVTVHAYRKLRWGGKTGLLLEAA